MRNIILAGYIYFGIGLVCSLLFLILAETVWRTTIIDDEELGVEFFNASNILFFILRVFFGWLPLLLFVVHKDVRVYLRGRRREDFHD